MDNGKCIVFGSIPKIIIQNKLRLMNIVLLLDGLDFFYFSLTASTTYCKVLVISIIGFRGDMKSSLKLLQFQLKGCHLVCFRAWLCRTVIIFYTFPPLHIPAASTEHFRFFPLYLRGWHKCVVPH